MEVIFPFKHVRKHILNLLNFFIQLFLIFNLIKKYFRIKNESIEISRILIKYFY